MIKISHNRKTCQQASPGFSIVLKSTTRERNIPCLCQQLSLMLWFEQKMLNCFERHNFPSHCITFVRSGRDEQGLDMTQDDFMFAKLRSCQNVLTEQLVENPRLSIVDVVKKSCATSCASDFSSSQPSHFLLMLICSSLSHFCFTGFLMFPQHTSRFML